MSENKKKGWRKFLLVATASVLVAAISVGATLAYLTAESTTMTNEFTAAGGITGAVHEPNWDVDKATNFVPGDEIPKDPLVQNTTTDTDIWAGVRVDFYIDEESWDSTNSVWKTTKTAVDLATLQKFVDITIDTTNWTEIAGGTGNSHTNSKYYIYNTILKASTGTDQTSTVSGTYTSNKADCSSPLFTLVTPKSGIVLKDLDPETADSYSTDYSKLDTAKPYKSFNFYIDITGYGVKAYVAASQPDGLKNETGDTKAQSAILYHLGGTSTDVTT